jgi:hypothetical protein
MLLSFDGIVFMNRVQGLLCLPVFFNGLVC